MLWGCTCRVALVWLATTGVKIPISATFLGKVTIWACFAQPWGTVHFDFIASGAHGLGLHFTDLVGEGVLRTQTSKGFALRTFKQTDSPPPLGP